MPTAKKATKKTPAKKTTKKAAKVSTKKKGTGGGRKKYGGLNPNEIKTLECLVKGDCTRKDMQKATGIEKGWSKMLGSPTKGISEDSMEGRKLIKSAKYEPQEGESKSRAGFVYSITAAGKKALEKANKEKAADK